MLDAYVVRGGDLFLRFLRRSDELEGLDHGRVARTVPTIVQAIMDQRRSASADELAELEREAVAAVVGYLRRRKEEQDDSFDSPDDTIGVERFAGRAHWG